MIEVLLVLILLALAPALILWGVYLLVVALLIGLFFVLYAWVNGWVALIVVLGLVFWLDCKREESEARMAATALSQKK